MLQPANLEKKYFHSLLKFLSHNAINLNMYIRLFWYMFIFEAHFESLRSVGRSPFLLSKNKNKFFIPLLHL